MVEINFNASEHEPMQTFEVLPAGEYVAIVENSKMKQTKSGTGEYVEITWSILDDRYKNKKVWTRLNIRNKNETAMRIANKELRSICDAISVSNIKDTDELLNKVCGIKVIAEERKDRPGSFSNRVDGYYKVNGQQKQSGTSEKPPWKK
jgi:hypothetical protein